MSVTTSLHTPAVAGEVTGSWCVCGIRNRRGLIVRVVDALCATFLLVVGGGPAVGGPPAGNRMATWNTQRPSGRWTAAREVATA
ncbi:hypothetical protein ACFV0T_40140 [Streptomyces sp. NPDC059582]|uniref:hypothetical protein n=1 Tax=Streptomyces sp. NPDC059582 TaxID=3346875 RepID=UPI0036CB6F2D